VVIRGCEGTIYPSGQAELERWVAPFLEALGRVERGRWAPLYLHGLLSPAERKNVEQIAACVAPEKTQQLHHFVSASPWKVRPVQEVLYQRAQEILVRECMPRCPTCGRENPSHVPP
jgi:SRSO17 transposase